MAWLRRETYDAAHGAILKRIERLLGQESLTNGDTVAELEHRLAERCGAAHCVAVSSATTGLMLALRALAGDGGEVVAPGFAFNATILAPLWNGNTLRLLPVDEGTLTLDPVAVEAHCAQQRPAAILAIGTAGNPSGLTALRAVARRHGVPFIIDAAACLGARVDGAGIGTLGDAVVVSLSAKKVLPAGEGGVVLTNSADLAARLARLRTYGSRDGFVCLDRGMNGRLGELNAAVALESLPWLDGILAGRRRFAALLDERLAAWPGAKESILRQTVEAEVEETASDLVHQVPADRRDRLVTELRALGLDAVPFYDPPIYRHPAFARMAAIAIDPGCARVDRLASRTVGFPSRSSYGEAEADRIAAVFRRVLADGR